MEEGCVAYGTLAAQLTFSALGEVWRVPSLEEFG